MHRIGNERIWPIVISVSRVYLFNPSQQLLEKREEEKNNNTCRYSYRII